MEVCCVYDLCINLRLSSCLFHILFCSWLTKRKTKELFVHKSYEKRGTEVGREVIFLLTLHNIGKY